MSSSRRAHDRARYSNMQFSTCLMSLFFIYLYHIEQSAEKPEPGQCVAGQFMCISDRRCVPQSSICNGIPECRDGSDEHNCGKLMIH